MELELVTAFSVAIYNSTEKEQSVRVLFPYGKPENNYDNADGIEISGGLVYGKTGGASGCYDDIISLLNDKTCQVVFTTINSNHFRFINNHIFVSAQMVDHTQGHTEMMPLPFMIDYYRQDNTRLNNSRYVIGSHHYDRNGIVVAVPANEFVTIIAYLK